MKIKCQICEGRGCVPLGFYETCEELDRSKVEECRACMGKGYDWEITLQPATTGQIVIENPPFTPWYDPIYPPNTWISSADLASQPCNIFEYKMPFGAGVHDETGR